MSALHQKMCHWDHNPNLWILIPVTHLDSDSSVNPLDSDPSNTFGLWHPCPLVCVGTDSLDSVSFPKVGLDCQDPVIKVPHQISKRLGHHIRRSIRHCTLQ